ncbi:hypothetical protein G6F62_012998 [Rhizopus arrhizus]|nr:hypothetical protein G6F62_012998 [Rhizopus arrhizus]
MPASSAAPVRCPQRTDRRWTCPPSGPPPSRCSSSTCNSRTSPRWLTASALPEDICHDQDPAGHRRARTATAGPHRRHRHQLCRRCPSGAGGGTGLAGVRALRHQRFAQLDRAGHPAAAGHGDEPGRRLRRAYQPPLRLLPAARSHGPWRAPRGGCAGAGGGGRAGWVHRLLVGRPAAGRAGHQDRRRQPAAEHQLPAAGRGWCADGAVRAEPCVESAAGPRRRQRRR